MIVRGSMRSWTWSETVGTSKRSALRFARPNQLRVEVRVVGVVFFPLSLSVAGVTNPTGGLFARFLPLCSYCSMGFFLVALLFVGFAIRVPVMRSNKSC